MKSQVSSLNQRKMDHVIACFDDSVDLQRDSFAAYKLRYCALPEISLGDVRTATLFAGKKISAPLLISSMTGGVGAAFRQINRNLAIAAEELQIPLGLGSMKVLLNHDEARASYEIRDVAPTTPVIANLGLVSFNYGLKYDDVDRIIDIVRPDAFGFHLNALQECVQEGGDTNFGGLLKHLEEIMKRCPLPIYIKECGGGIAPELVYRLAEMGIQYVDISGNDGTSWAAVEGRLSADPSMGDAFRDFGLPTAWIMERLDFNKVEQTKVVASGGIRNGIQAVKALALGAQYVSTARPFLKAAAESSARVFEEGKRMIREIQTAMFLTGVSELNQLDRSCLL